MSSCVNFYGTTAGVEYTLEIQDITYVVTKTGLDPAVFFFPSTPADPYATISFPGYEYSVDGKRTDKFYTPTLNDSENGTKTFTFIIHKLFATENGSRYSTQLKWDLTDEDLSGGDTICEKNTYTIAFAYSEAPVDILNPVSTCANGSIQFARLRISEMVKVSKQ